MTKKIEYTDGPIGDVEVVEDFLPAPDQLVFKDDTVDVTIPMSKSIFDYFKKEAENKHVPSELLIQKVLDLYAIRSQRVPSK